MARSANRLMSGCVRPRMLRFACNSTIFLLAFLSPVLAQDWKDEISPAAPGDFPLPEPGSFRYTVSWKGLVNAGMVDLRFAPKEHPKKGSYVVKSDSKSTGAASSLFPYWSTFWSEIDPVRLVGKKFFATENDDKESISTTSRFHSQYAETKESTKSFKTGITKKETKRFDFTPTHDLFSAILFVRSQKLNDGDKMALVVHPFGTPYLVRVWVADHNKHHGKAAIHLRISMRKIDRKTQELKPYKKMRKEASLWIGDDERRIPLELRASVFIGDIRATLVNTG